MKILTQKEFEEYVKKNPKKLLNKILMTKNGDYFLVKEVDLKNKRFKGLLLTNKKGVGG